MKKEFFCLTIICTCILSACSKHESINSFDWLAGKWIGRYDTVPIFEQWRAPEGKVMNGRGGVLSGKDTAFAERISIGEREDGIYYTAIVAGNPAPVDFKFTGFKNDTAVFEDPTHDFPQRVLYYKDGDDTFYACIDGKFKGKYVKEEFNYKKAKDW